MEDDQSMVEPDNGSFYTARSNLSDASLPLGRVGEEQVKQAIRTVVESTLRDTPLRLLSTQDGKLYTHNALIRKFIDSDKCRSLITLTTTGPTLQLKQFIAEVVRNYFAYAMLSHRWEDDELTFKDLKEESVYVLSVSRVHKVRSFCLQARKCGLDWAWVDTCCIDQASSAEVQKSISSMFSWYHRSALTIIYLSDVTESSLKALLCSQWFRRGWTLQELLAAKVIRLYKRNWDSFVRRAAFNHKDIAEILAALESATGIEQSYLKSYSPSVEHPRMKLGWARHRVTKEKEDEAYCLMGIFGFTITVRYGEGENAFACLLMEIMKRTGDATLLDWTGQPSSTNSCLPSSPRCFLDDPFHVLGNLDTVLVDPPHVTLSFASVAKIVWVFKRATRRAKRNSSHPHLVNSHASGGNGYPACTVTQAVRRVNGTPQIATARSNQSNTQPRRPQIDVSLRQLLEQPLRPYNLTPDIRIIVPCFAHEVQLLYFEPNSNAYVCQADGIKRFTLVTSERLRVRVHGHHSTSGYLLARPWDPRLSLASSNTYHDSLSLLRQRLADPFFAMLLELSDYGWYRRISTEERIVAQLELPPPQTYGVRSLHLH